MTAGTIIPEASPPILPTTSVPVIDLATKKKRVIYPFWLGGAAACCAVIVTHPIDLVKVRLQTTHGSKNVSAIKTAISIIKETGVQGLYRGLTGGLLRQITYSTMRFGTYDKIKNYLSEGGTGENLSFPKMVLAAAIGGAAGGACGNPADVVMVRMQNDAKLPPAERRNYRNALEGLYRIVKAEGIGGIFRGIGPNVNRAVLMNVSQVATYDEFKHLLLSTGYFRDNIWTHFNASLLSGLVATTICSPADVIKTRVMSSSSKSRGALSLISEIIRKEGPFALFKGWVPSFIRLGPHTILTFICLEKFKELYVAGEIFGIKFR